MAGKKDVTAYKRPHKLKYGKWGLIFILPFFICYGIIFTKKKGRMDLCI